MIKVDKCLTAEIISLIRRMVFLTFSHPKTSITLSYLIYQQYRYCKKRERNSDRELLLPTFLIYSITKTCNLHCKGCYAKIHQDQTGSELTIEQVNDLFKQSDELGIGLYLIAGGEPFTRLEVVNLFKQYPKMLFLVFTNGLLLNKGLISGLSRNTIPILSLEGDQVLTNKRRGSSVYDKLEIRFGDLERSGRCWGVSLTTTTENIDEVLSEAFIKKLIRHNCRIFFFVEYVPISPNTDQLILSDTDKTKLIKRTDEYSRHLPAVFIAFPGDEDKWEGCLAAGRGFVHIQADGSLEPCPFAPFSDSNLKDMPLKEALRSKLLSEIRKKHHLLHESKGGCALWENKELVKQLLETES